MGRTIICSSHKLTYQQAQHLVDGVSPEPVIAADDKGQAALKFNLQTLCDFADHLRQGRLEVSMSYRTTALQLTKRPPAFSVAGRAEGMHAKHDLSTIAHGKCVVLMHMCTQAALNTFHRSWPRNVP